MSIDFEQLTELVIVPTLKYLDPIIPFSNSAVKLLQMTACHESHCGTYLRQLGGPALGIYQMEPATEVDIMFNYLVYRPDISKLIEPTSLVTDLAYATAMARVHYYRHKKALPDSDDLIGLANYAKLVWNTEDGKATSRDYYAAFEKYAK